MSMEHEIDFRRLCDDLRTLADLFETNDLRDASGHHDYRSVKALAATSELWDYLANLIETSDEMVDD